VKFRYELRPELFAKANTLEEFANGAMQVSVLLNDGRRFPDVLLSDGKYVIAMRGHLELPFSIEDVAEIYQSDDDRKPKQRGGWKFWDDWKS
jgi:hypothetical protein